ncbi:MAG TPA: ABC transporter permease [Geminicoccaceae bacterium]|nr:ABC transporter permease [Geminicoccus sp.]HMU52987.1 ABC transporter permease [Geminicoccaceae bacterium]
MKAQIDVGAMAANSAPTTGQTFAKLRGWVLHNLPLIAVFALLFLIWEVGVRAFGVAEYILPRPSVILGKIVANAGLLAAHAGATFIEIALGFGLSVVVGVGLAAVIVHSAFLERLIMPLLVSLKTIPKVALAPILIIWFGYGLLPKVLIAFLISFFPIVISSVIGLRSAEKEMIHLVRSMGASQAQTFFKIRLPKALPSIFGGFRIAMIQAVVGAIVAEYLAAEKGLGYLQLVAQSRLDMPLLFASVVVLSLLGIVLFNLVALTERLMTPWAARTGESPE